LDYPTALGTTEYLSQEFDYIPLKVAFAKFNYIGKMLAGTEGFSSFREFLLRQFLPLYERLGFEAQDSDSSLNSRLREEVIQIMCDLGHEDCEKQVAGLLFSGNSHRAHVALRGRCKIVLSLTVKETNHTRDIQYLFATTVIRDNTTVETCLKRVVLIC